MQKLFLTFFYTGLSPKAPGTVGSIAGAAAAYAILRFAPVSTLCLFLFSIKIIDDYESRIGIHDDKSIVIDEVAGVWLAISLSGEHWLGFLLSVVFFRFLDILKPSIIGRIDKGVKGGLGVMGDDMVAGFFAGLLSAICYGITLKLNLQLPALEWFSVYR